MSRIGLRPITIPDKVKVTVDGAVVKVLHDAFKRGMEEPTFVEVLKKLEQEPVYQSTEDYRAYIQRELVAQKRTVEELGLTQE